MNLRTFRPSYLVRRLSQVRFQRADPEAPWLTAPAVLLLQSYLKPTDRGFEWGSGRSTIWFAKRVGHLTSVEHSSAWFHQVQSALERQQLDGKVDLRLVPCDLRELDEPETHEYVQPALALADGTLDFALVDGTIRLTCMKTILPKLKAGGLLILDNANRFIPNDYAGRCTTVHEPRREPRSPQWTALLRSLESWRWLHTTDGIWDTRLWVKSFPASS